MRLIDADAFKTWIDEYVSVFKKSDKAEIKGYISHQPSIEIIRCRECRYASHDGTYGCMCEHFNDTSDAYHRMWSDDYCSYGEREGE